MVDFKTNLYTIKEVNAVAKREGLTKVIQSYASIYGMIRGNRVPVVKAGNRYLLRICDIEKALMANTVQVNGIRRIS